MEDDFMREQILYYALKYRGDWNKIAKAMINQEIWLKAVYHGHYITIVDDEYPDKLKRLQYAPWILFYKGNLQLLNEESIAIVGGREHSKYGADMTVMVTEVLKQKYVIVSGLAKGIDAIAHHNALDHKTIAVLGCGIDRYYPIQNKELQKSIAKHHLLLSEYPDDVKPYPAHFPWRNRILAALSKGIVVIEAKVKSGTLKTIHYGLELNLPIYCIPHCFDNPLGRGNNVLIAQGAYILAEEEDLCLI